MSDDRLIVAIDLPNALDGLNFAGQLGDAVSFYKIGLGMLTGGGLALAMELKQDHGKRITNHKGVGGAGGGGEIQGAGFPLHIDVENTIGSFRECGLWLAGDGDNPPVLREILSASAATPLSAWPGSKAVNNARNDGEALIEPQQDED